MAASTPARSLFVPLTMSSAALVSGTEHTQRPFAITTRNLLMLGAVSMDKFADSDALDDEVNGLDLPFLAPGLEPPGSATAQPVKLEDAAPASNMQHVAQLHQTCHQVFGNSEALKFEFLQEQGPDKKQCILTITRPNALTRSYTTKAEFKRKSDAKAQAATIAVEMGAVDFILYGNKEELSGKRKNIVAPLDSHRTKKLGKVDPDVKEEGEDELDPYTKEIEGCCLEWRGGRVKPRYVFYSEGKGSTKVGCAMVIELSPHIKRVYSVGPEFEKRSDAKRETSSLALESDVLNFIKYGNGQTEPPPPLPEDQMIVDPPKIEPKERGKGMTLQDYFDTLPRPFPEPVGDKGAGEINAPSWLNTTMQTAKGARLSLQFHWISDNKSGLHGCLLRLQRPGDSRSYLVDKLFSKRADAKSAVCLLAMSEGIGDHIRGIANAVESKITPEMRKRAEQLLRTFGWEYSRMRKGVHPIYDFTSDRGAYGCTVTLALSTDPAEDEVRKWTVPPDFGTKNDAKFAAICLAADEGGLEFVRFQGRTPPPDYTPGQPWKPRNNDKARQPSVKLEEAPTRLGRSPYPTPTGPRKPTLSGQVKLGVPLLETKEEAIARRRAYGSDVNANNMRPSNFNQPYRHDPPNRPRLQSLSSDRGSYNPRFYNPAAMDLSPDYVPSPTTPTTPDLGYLGQRSNAHDRPLMHPPPLTPPYASGMPMPPPPPPLHASDPYYRPPGPHLAPPMSAPPHPGAPHSFPPVPPPGPLAGYPYPPPPPPPSAAAGPPTPQSAYPAEYPGHMRRHSFGQQGSFRRNDRDESFDRSSRAEKWTHDKYEEGEVSPRSRSRSRNGRDPDDSHRSRRDSLMAEDKYGRSGRDDAYDNRPRRRSEAKRPRSPSTSSSSSEPGQLKRHRSDVDMDVGSSRSHSEVPVKDLPLGRGGGGSPTPKSEVKSEPKSVSPPGPTPPKPGVQQLQEPLKDVKPNTMPVNKSSSTQSFVQALLKHCAQKNLAQPTFYHSAAAGSAGESGYKVWVVMGKEKLELPKAFSEVREGYERLARQVILRLRNQSKTG